MVDEGSLVSVHDGVTALALEHKTVLFGDFEPPRAEYLHLLVNRSEWLPVSHAGP